MAVIRSMLSVVLVTATVVSQGPTMPVGVTSFGAGCGPLGSVMQMSLSHGVVPGGSTTLSLVGLPLQSPAVLWAGTSRHQWGATTLPLGLRSAGMPGCNLLVAPQVPVAFQTGSGLQLASLSVPPTAAFVGFELCLQTVMHEPTANPAGLTWSHGLAAVIGPVPQPTTMVSSISQFGITYQFAQPVEAGQFVNGDWFVVGPVQVIDILPPCTTQGGRLINGAMVNPDPSTRDHGYDSDLYGAGNAQHYLPSLNKALGLSPGAPLGLQPNESLVKVISNTNPTLVPYLTTCSVLTCVAAVPPMDSFRPPYAGADHQVRFDVSMLDWNALAALQPAANMPVMAVEEAEFERPWLDHCPQWVSRQLHPAENMPDYGRDMAAVYNQASLLCNLALPQSQRRTLLVRLVQIGIDFWGNVEHGCWWEGLGGHDSGRKWPILFAGRMLNYSAMLDVGLNYRSFRNGNGSYQTVFGEDAQTFFVAETSPGVLNWGHGGYTQQQIGMAEFGFSHTISPQTDHEAWMQDPYRRCCTANAWIGGVLCARIMGLVTEWNHPAIFDYLDRYTQIEPVGWTREWEPWTGRMWDLYRSQY